VCAIESCLAQCSSQNCIQGQRRIRGKFGHRGYFSVALCTGNCWCSLESCLIQMSSLTHNGQRRTQQEASLDIAVAFSVALCTRNCWCSLESCLTQWSSHNGPYTNNGQRRIQQEASLDIAVAFSVALCTRNC